MRVLLVSGSFPPMKCGVGDYTAALAVSLARRRDVTVGVLTSVGADATIAPGVRVLPVVRKWGIPDAPHILSALRAWRPDIVHIQYPTHVYGRIQWVLPTIVRLLNGPVAQTWHEYHPGGCIPNLANALLPGGLVVVRPNYLETMPSWYRRALSFKMVEYIPNASSIPAVNLSQAERDGILERWGLRAGRPVAYFGFPSPAKGIELLFEIADPEVHRLVLICDLNPSDDYQKELLERTRNLPWRGKVTVTGFLPAEDVGRLLAAAEAAVFPFREGGGKWNTSLHGAMAQGTFVLTVSGERSGYFADGNIYYARPGNVGEMRAALNTHIGTRGPAKMPTGDWDIIAERHARFYERMGAFGCSPAK